MSDNKPRASGDKSDGDPGAPTLDGARVVFVFPELELGGAERQALLLARYLKRERNAEVEFWGLGGQPGRVAKACDNLGIPWRLVPLQWFTSRTKRLKSLAQFAWMLRRARPDIILPYLIMPNVACGLVWRMTGARVCVWNQRNSGSVRLGPEAERRAVQWTPCFVSNSEYGATFLTQTLGAPTERVRVIHNGIELAPPQANRATWRRRLGIGDDTVAACMVANLTKSKDHETLWRAWRRVINSAAIADRSVVLLLAGSLDGYESTHHFVKATAYDLELSKGLRFLGHVDDVSGLLGAVEFGVFSSRSESSPNGVLECMGAGLAVAGTNIPGIREAVGPDGYQLLSLPGDSETLADRILRLVTDSTMRAKLGAANRLRVESDFSPQRMCEETAALIIEGLREGPVRGRRAWRGLSAAARTSAVVC